jgi:hypothetical protein
MALMGYYMIGAFSGFCLGVACGVSLKGRK